MVRVLEAREEEVSILDLGHDVVVHSRTVHRLANISLQQLLPLRVVALAPSCKLQ